MALPPDPVCRYMEEIDSVKVAPLVVQKKKSES